MSATTPRFDPDALLCAACRATERHGISSGVLLDLAAASEASHPGRAPSVHAARIEQRAAEGGTPAYEEAAANFARMGRWLHAASQEARLADLRHRHRRKRNFMPAHG